MIIVSQNDLEQFGDDDDESDADQDDSDADSGTTNRAGKRNLKLPNDVYFPVLKGIEEEIGYTPARLAESDRSDEDDAGKNREPTTSDVDTEGLAFEKIHRRYGQFQTGEHFPEPLRQFLQRYTNTEGDEITTNTDETKFVPKADLRDAFNAWAQICLRDVRNDPDRSVDDVDLKELPSGAFTGPMKAQLDVELKEGRPRFKDRPRQTVWFGLELTDDGKDLVDLEGKFAESE